MPSFERGVYEPPNDDIRVFDDDEQDVDEEGSRLPLLIVIALLVLAAFGGVVYLAWSQGVERGRADAPRMIVAAPGPVKEAATDNSGTQTHSLKIYDQPAPADDSSDDSAPPPPTAATKPAASPVVIAPPPTTPKPAPAIAIAPKPPAAVAATPKPATVTPKRVAIVEKPASKPASVVKQAAAETASAPPAPLVTTPPPVAAAPKAEATALSGAYELQIGAYKSQDEADAAWKAYKFKHPSAAGYSEDVHKADLGDKGIWYRLRIGPFSDKAAASGACDKLKADGGACLLAK